jgi:hypothetical protein
VRLGKESTARAKADSFVHFKRHCISHFPPEIRFK